MTAENTLVEAADTDVDPLAGAGLVSSIADVATAVDDADPEQLSFALAGAALDALGTVADPLDATLTSAVGWLIEHVAFLREPLDALAGDPDQIVAQARTWANVATELRAVADAYRADAVAGWDGDAATAYAGAVDRSDRALRDVADRADELASLVLGTGAAVGTVRALVRDLIADFVAWVAKVAIGALAAAPVTMAASTAAAVATVGYEAVALAQYIAARISRLLDHLAEAGDDAARIVDGMRRTTADLLAAAPPAHEHLDALPLAAVAEAGKQFTGAELEPGRDTTPAR